MTITVNDVVTKYVSLRDLKREMVKEHEQALEPIDEQLSKLESWLLAKMGEDCVENYKTEGGTAYKTTKTSCTIGDGTVFKRHVFAPVAEKVAGILANAGFTDMSEAVLELILASAKWNLVDFRALKKGVEETIEDTEQVPPGLNVTQIATVNVRSK